MTTSAAVLTKRPPVNGQCWRISVCRVDSGNECGWSPIRRNGRGELEGANGADPMLYRRYR